MAFIEFRGWAWPDDAPQLLRTSILDVQAFKDAMAKHGGAMKEEADGIPTAFISYSWDSDAHKTWVRQLAEKLRSRGVRVILDQWELSAGTDRTHFMESNIVAIPAQKFPILVHMYSAPRSSDAQFAVN